MNKIGRYVIIAEMGRGAMGIVYKASDPTIDREVALKVVSLNASPEQGTESPRHMFMREVRAAGRLSHPSIVTIHDAFDDKETQTSCIVMEFIPGMTLEKVIEAGHALTVEQTLNLVRQVAEGLDYAHRNQVIHRDLKPANILVTEDGRAKITDFGIAKVLAREGAARTVGVMGTPSYMSPEQVKGGEVDARTDIFSLGIVLFTMLAGKKPFAGNTAAVMFKIVYEEPAAPSTLNPQLTPAFDYVIKRCLAKDRKNRYPSARELINDLDDLQNGRPPRSQTASPTAASTSSPNETAVLGTPDVMKILSQPSTPSKSGPGPVVSPVPPAPGGVPIAPAPASPMVTPPRPGPAKAAPQPPAPRPGPPPRPSAPPAKPPAESPGSAADLPATMAMPISELMKAASRQPVPRSTPAPPAASSAPQGAQRPRVPTAGAPMPPGLPLTGQTLPMPIPDLSAIGPAAPPSSPSAPKPTRNDEPTLMDQTVPLPMPGLSGVSSKPPSPPRSTPAAAPPPDTSLNELMERPQPMGVPNLASVSQATGSATVGPAPPPAVMPRAPVPQEVVSQPTMPAAPISQEAESPPAMPAPPPPAVVMPPDEPGLVSGAAQPKPRPKLLPAVLGGMVLVLLALGTWGYWKFHQPRPVPAAPPAQAAVQTTPTAPPPEPTPTVVPTPSPAPAATTEAATPPANPAPAVPRKTAIHKPKPVAAQHPSAPEPAAPPPEPQPAAVTPAPAPPPPAPSPEATAKAEAAKFANVPHIVQVECNFGLKEATFTFSSGGRTLFEDTFKGKKKKKEGLLGIKGTYQGSFSHTITVPAGASEVSLHVVAKDGATDLTKTIKMPAPGGFVPTLSVDVDNEHLSLNWKGSAPAL